MNPAIYVVIFFMILLVLFEQISNNNAYFKQIIKSKHRKDHAKMLELARKFINKQCMIYTLNSQFSSGIEGTIKEVTDGAILIQTKKSVEAVNLDFIVRIVELPLKKNGKQKTIW